MTVRDWVEFSISGKRPESDAYRKHRGEALAAAGLEEEVPPEDLPLERWSMKHHLEAVQKRRRAKR
jgi:hypothetical protein